MIDAPMPLEDTGANGEPVFRPKGNAPMSRSMTLSDRIRRAALGPTPKPATLRADWIGIDGVAALRHAFGHGCGLPDWSYSTTTEKRLFLLFVAEALDGL